MKYWFAILVLLIAGCSQARNKETYDNEINDDFRDICSYQSPEITNPENPGLIEIQNIEKYNDDLSACVELPGPEEGVIELSRGCYKGCLNFSGTLKITGKGASETLVVCEDKSAEAAFSGVNADVQINSISISSQTRGVSLEGGSSMTIRDSAIVNCVRGGVRGCLEGDQCDSDVKIINSLIADIDPGSEGTVSYGITIGKGRLEINDSKLEGFHSFAVAVWGGGTLSIENSLIRNIYGVSGDFHGVGVYAENSDITLGRVKIENVATSFILSENNDDNIRKAELQDIILIGGANSSGEQGGIVLDGNLEVELARVSISESRGNGIFGNAVRIIAQDIKVIGVSSDSTTENGFGIVFFDSQAEFERIMVKEVEKAGILVDGNSQISVRNIQISGVKADQINGEFGLGAAVQNGALLELENGIISETREAGIMAVNAELILKNVEIRDILQRKCSEDGYCTFADGVPLGHGVSLYSGSKLSFQNVFIVGNSNGFNLESSTAERLGGEAFFIDNNSAVNAWNIDDAESLEKAFDGVTFCNNKSIFTTDVQPVREGF